MFRFALRHWRFLAFGMLTAFFSSFGQTYFIGAFGDAIRADYGLSYGEFGTIYSLATLGSAVALVWTGRFIDHWRLERFTVAVALGLVGACVLLGTVPPSDASEWGGGLGWLAGWPGASAWLPIAWLGLALFALRQTGQGLMSHTSMTSIGRRFAETRGRALSIAVIGYPLGQALLPAQGVRLMNAVGWQAAWLWFAGALAVIVIPVLLLLLRGASDTTVLDPHEADRQASGDAVTAVDAAALPERDRTRGEALRDPRFWLLVPAAVGPGFILTGVFFHQTFITDVQGWALTTWTAYFAVYSSAQIACSVAAGPLVDRVTARAVMPFYLLPLAAGLALLATQEGAWLMPTFLGLAGATAGLSVTLGGALWAELYGVEHLGAIRSSVTSLGIVGTAASPAGMGALIDAGVGLPAISWLAVGYLGLSVVGVVAALGVPGRGGAR